MIYKYFVRPLLFKFEPEKIHHLVSKGLKLYFSIPLMRLITNLIFRSNSSKSSVNVFGLQFSNPIGLAAGFDKEAELIDELACFGFGFIEIGTLTPLAQPGNPRPRMFRLPADQSLINRMGFNNSGVESALQNLKKRHSKVLVGGNIGKNKVTTNELAVNDYLHCFNQLFDWVDYFVVNVSSPNTPDLRALQDKEPLRQLLLALQTENKKHSQPKPILLKIAPDLSDEQLNDVIEIVKAVKIPGIVATNTTINRSTLLAKSSKLRSEMVGAGGLSGRAVHARSVEVVKYLCDRSENKFEVIGVGGIFTGADAQDFLNAGAKLVQVYTGFIYEGPSMVKKINKALFQ